MKLILSVFFCIIFNISAVNAAPPKLPKKSEETTKETTDEKVAPRKALGPPDTYDRGVPRTSFQGFMKFANKGDFEGASNYLDYSSLPSYPSKQEKAELARQLKVVLDQSLYIDPGSLSDVPEGYSEDNLEENQDFIGRVEAKGEKIDLLIERVPREDGKEIWKISSNTVKNIPLLHSVYGYGYFGEKISRLFPTPSFLGLRIWQWIIFFALLLICYGIAYVLTKLAMWFVYKNKNRFADELDYLFSWPLRLLLTSYLVRLNFDILHPTAEAKEIMKTNTAPIILSIWAGLQIISIIRKYLEIYFKTSGRDAVIVLLRPFANILKFLIIVVATLLWLENLGFKIHTILAGLGIGGLAVALAAQKSIENLIAGITLYISAPVKTGDLCRFNGDIGFIEEIGLRYTRIRTIPRTLLNIANSLFVDMKLENLSKRDEILYKTVIRLRYTTTPDQIRFILIEIRKLFYSHPKVDPKGARVRFVNFTTDSIELKVHVYIKSTVYAEFLGITEDINLQMMDIITKSGAEFAVPEHLISVQRKDKAEAETAKEAESQVAHWKTNQELYFPEFPKEKIEELHDTLKFPPEGAPSEEN